MNNHILNFHRVRNIRYTIEIYDPNRRKEKKWENENNDCSYVLTLAKKVEEIRSLTRYFRLKYHVRLRRCSIPCGPTYKAKTGGEWRMRDAGCGMEGWRWSFSDWMKF